MAVWQFDDGEAHSHNEIPVFQIPMQWLEPGDLARYLQWFTLSLEILGVRVPASPPLPARPALAQPLRLDLTNSVRNPSRRVRLTSSKKDFRRWLREHGLCFVAVARLQPQAREGNEPFPCRRRAGKEEPPLALVRPRRRAPTLRCIRLPRKQLQTVRYHVQRRQHTTPLCGGVPIDHGGV